MDLDPPRIAGDSNIDNKAATGDCGQGTHCSSYLNRFLGAAKFLVYASLAANISLLDPAGARLQFAV